MRIPFASLLLLTPLAALAIENAVRADVISNTCDLTSLPLLEHAKLRRFDLTGTIVHVEPISATRNSYVLDDGQSGAFLQGETESVKPGEIFHVRGHTIGNDYGERVLIVTKTEKIGTTNVPPPVHADAISIANGSLDYKRLSLRAKISDIFIDELDAAFVYFVLDSDNQIIYAVGRSDNFPPVQLSSLVGAETEVKGVFVPGQIGHRRFIGGLLHLSGFDAIRVTKDAVSNPYELPMLENVHYISPQSVRRMGRRRAHGTVLATWNGNKLILETADRQLHQVTLKHGQPLPNFGNTVTIGGDAGTDLYLINLDKAVCIIEDKTSAKVASAPIIQPADILTRDGYNQINAEYYGRLVSIRGIVTTPNTAIYDSRHLYLNCKTHIIPVNISSIVDFSPPEIGSVVTATGVCLMDVDNWQPDNPAPAIRGFFLVARTAEDIKVESNPPFWTPARTLSITGASLALLFGFIVWNLLLNRLVRRRSMQLRASQINEERAEIKSDERMRLAVELHDSLSQNLSGIACQLSATAESLHLAPEILAENLATAQRMLDSSRTELKRCLFDLRSEALETEDFEEAIRMTLSPYLDQSGVTIKFLIHRAKLDESLAHTTLCIIRELVSNAIRHGKASEIRIAGSLVGGKLLFSVCDNGLGFDINSKPGPAEGHFGLEGICERVERHNGTMEISSNPSNGTKIRIVLVLPDDNSQS